MDWVVLTIDPLLLKAFFLSLFEKGEDVEENKPAVLGYLRELGPPSAPDGMRVVSKT